MTLFTGEFKKAESANRRWLAGLLAGLLTMGHPSFLRTAILNNHPAKIRAGVFPHQFTINSRGLIADCYSGIVCAAMTE
ncbi:MAG: hypothetical protein R3C17_13135 [Planctomycetaceae bacterium]